MRLVLPLLLVNVVSAGTAFAQTTPATPVPETPTSAPLPAPAPPATSSEAPPAPPATTPAPASAAAVPPPGSLYPPPIDAEHSYVVQSSQGPVTIDRAQPTEVGRWGWTLYGNHGIGIPGAAEGDTTISMVGIRHWATPKFGWEAAAGLSLWKQAGDGSPTIVGLGGQGALLLSLARYEYLNVFAAGRAIIVPYAHPADDVGVFQFGASGEVAAEFFLDGLQLFHSGPLLRTSRALSVTLGFGLGMSLKHAFASGSDGVTEFKLSTTNANDVVDGFTTGTFAITYYFGGS